MAFEFEFETATFPVERLPIRPPEGDQDVTPDRSGMDVLAGGAADSSLAPGWLTEQVETVATLGLETPESPGQDVLEEQPVELLLTGELPTQRVLEGDERVEDVLDLFGVGSSDEGGEAGEGEAAFDVGFNFDLDLDFDLGGEDR